MHYVGAAWPRQDLDHILWIQKKKKKKKKSWIFVNARQRSALYECFSLEYYDFWIIFLLSKEVLNLILLFCNERICDCFWFGSWNMNYNNLQM